MVLHSVDDLIRLFEQVFWTDYNTRLVRGNSEPVYLPANQECHFNQIVFAHGYYASALHEIAHWLVAGEQRRTLEDYGYWYCPDGRDRKQQAEFEQVELKPQAIEWALSVTAGFDFNVSCDNLSGEQSCRYQFHEKVRSCLLQLLEKGFNKRTSILLEVLSNFYQTPWPLQPEQFPSLPPLELQESVCAV